MTVWGDWVKNSWNFRAGLDYGTSWSNDSQVCLWLAGWSQSTQSTINYGKSVLEYSLDGGASWTNLTNVYPSALGYGATAHNSDASVTFDRWYGQDRSVLVQHWFSSPGSSDSAYVTGGRAQAWVTIPARPYESPNPPASPSVSGSGTTATVRWSGDYTDSSHARPWSGVRVYRSTDSGGWERVADLGWDATSWTDSGLTPNHRYAYSVASWNSTGESSRASCGTVRTTPSAPTDVTASRVSDSTQKVTWSLGENAAATWESVEVQRSADGGAWESLATLPAATTNYSDASTEADHAYAYRIRSSNSGGSSGWAESGTVWTTPCAPSKVTAAATGASSVSVSVTGASSIAEAFDVERRVGSSGTWGDATRVASLPATMPSGAGENYYRVRAVRGSLLSAWTVSAAVTTVAQPKAPTLTGVGARYATGSSATIGWRPNHPDGSAQVAAQVEATGPDGKATVTAVTGAAASCKVGPLAKGHWSVRVRTKGAWAEGDGWGEWSQAAAFDVYDPSKVAFKAPTSGATVDRVPVTVTWDASDETGVSSQFIEVLSASGVVLHSATLSGAARSYRLDQSTLMPQNRSSYAVRLTVWAGSGLSVTSVLSFSTLWSAPDLARASVTYDEAMAAHVRASFGTAASLPATVSVDVERVLPDGSTLPIGSGLSDGQSVIDRLPPLNSPYSYRLTAHSAAGSTSVATFGTTARCEDVVLNFGTDASRAVRCRYNPGLSHSYARGVEFLHFADGGASGGLPVAYGLDTRDRSTSLSWDVIDFAAADSMARSEYDCWFRLPTGQRGRAGVSWDIDRKAPGVWTVSAKLTETVWEEPALG